MTNFPLPNKVNEQLAALNKLNAELRQVEAHSRELLTKKDASERAAARAAEEARGAGARKQEQDFLVDRMNEEIKQLQDRIAALAQQVQTQKLENAAVAGLLAEAQTEMEGLELQKKRRQGEWQANVATFGRMNEALAAAAERARERRAELAALEGEESGFRSRERAAQDEREKLASIEARVRGEADLLARRIADDNAARDGVAAELARAQKALEALEQQLPAANKLVAQLRTRATALQRDGDRIVTETAAIGEHVASALREQQAHDKTAQHSRVAAARVAEAVEAKLLQRAQLENEIARTRVEMLGVQASLEDLEAQLVAATRGVKQQEELSAKYEAEIRRHNDDIQRKQYEVDRLNRKIEQLQSRTREENTGPLEATIHNLGQEIAAKQKQCQELESFWLRSQSELVQLQREAQERADTIRDLKSRHAVLSQKQLRLDNALATQNREARELERSTAALQRDVERLNATVSRSASKRASLSSENAAMAAQARAALEDMQVRLYQLEQEVQAALVEKDTAATRTVELEEEALQWEKKIRMWQETQAAIDPNEGAAETAALQHDVRNLQVLYSRLLRDKERLVQEMERSIDRRGAEIVRTAPKRQVQGETARFQARRLLADLAKASKQLHDENAQLEAAIAQMTAEIQAAKAQIGDSDQEGARLERRRAEMQRIAEEALVARSRAAAAVARYQQLAKRYTAMDSESKAEARAATVEKEWARAADRAARVRQLYEALDQRFPEFREELRQLYKPFRGSIEGAAR